MKNAQNDAETGDFMTYLPLVLTCRQLAAHSKQERGQP